MHPITDWINEHMHSHGIYAVEHLSKYDSPLSKEAIEFVPKFSKKETEEAIRARGLGGDLEAEDDSVLVYGWTTAEALCTFYKGDCMTTAIGRGSRFRQALSQLQEWEDAHVVTSE